MASFDVLGVASILPFMSVLTNPQVIDSNAQLAFLYKKLSFQSREDFLFFLGLSVLVLFFVSLTIKAVTTWAVLRFTQMQSYSLCGQLIAGYLKQPYEWYLNKHSAELGNVVLAEVQQVVSGAIMPLLQVIAQGTVAVFIILLLMVINPQLALSVSLVLGASYLGLYTMLRGLLKRSGQARVVGNSGRFRALNDMFGGIKEVKVGGLERYMFQKFSVSALQYHKALIVQSAASQLPKFAMEFLAFGSVLSITLFLLKTSGSVKGAIPMIALYAVAAYRLLPALQQVYMHSSGLRFADAALEKLSSELSGLPAQTISEGSERTLPITRCVRLDSVSFTYPNANAVSVKEIDLEIEVGARVAFVGETGSGKSTLVDIILGVLRPQFGQIVVDGRPICEANLQAWQRSIGYVPQSIFLSDDSLRSNIAFGVPTNAIDDEAVWRASKVAQLHEFITSELPQGYDTVIGERGVRLSGGQRQRIGLARALYHNPSLLVLDEATSALDNVTEAAVMQAISELDRKVTVLMVAHRLSTVRACDLICLLSEGRLVASGTYGELVQNEKRFRRLSEVNAVR
jgi:ABC-type bacteriocin/lantibiotic exporter with double-glycine peptidase domain